MNEKSKTANRLSRVFPSKPWKLFMPFRRRGKTPAPLSMYLWLGAVAMERASASSGIRSPGADEPGFLGVRVATIPRRREQFTTARATRGVTAKIVLAPPASGKLDPVLREEVPEVDDVPACFPPDFTTAEGVRRTHASTWPLVSAGARFPVDLRPRETSREVRSAW